MSIWMSHSTGLIIPDRDQYTGESTEEPIALAYDVASSWGEVFRFAVYSVKPHPDRGWQGAGNHIASYLTADEGRQLIALIQSGIAAVEPDAAETVSPLGRI